MKKNKLPYVAIEGVGKNKEEVLDSLIGFELLLFFMGWEFDNDMNIFELNNHIITYNSINEFMYACRSGCDYPKRFKATQHKAFTNWMIKQKYIQ